MKIGIFLRFPVVEVAHDRGEQAGAVSLAGSLVDQPLFIALQHVVGLGVAGEKAVDASAKLVSASHGDKRQV